MMSIEMYYAPLKDAPPVMFASLVQRLAEVGLLCTVEPEAEGMDWLAFTGCASAILASVADGEVSLATLHCAATDDPSVPGRIDAVMQSLGLSADENAEYA